MRVLCLLFAAGLVAGTLGVGASATPDAIVAQGHIEAGVMGASTLVHFALGDVGADLPWSFRFDPVEARGAWIEAQVHDGGGGGYYVQFHFLDNKARLVHAECEMTEDSHALLMEPVGEVELRERCLVPHEATLAVAAANHGLDLDVTIIRLQ